MTPPLEGSIRQRYLAERSTALDWNFWTINNDACHVHEFATSALDIHRAFVVVLCWLCRVTPGSGASAPSDEPSVNHSTDLSFFFHRVRTHICATITAAGLDGLWKKSCVRRASRVLPASDVADVSCKVMIKFCKDRRFAANYTFWLSAAQRCNCPTSANPTESLVLRGDVCASAHSHMGRAAEGPVIIVNVGQRSSTYWIANPDFADDDHVQKGASIPTLPNTAAYIP
jgi:hypothetical protein